MISEDRLLDTIESLVEKVIGHLLADDADLLRNDVNERSITHRFAIYVQELFPEWNVDCEYNRDHDQTKKLSNYRGRSAKADDTSSISVFPDVIVHKRMTNQNLLVIEVKKSTNNDPDKFDLSKLDAFKEDLHYQYALFLRLRVGDVNAGVERLHWV